MYLSILDSRLRGNDIFLISDFLLPATRLRGNDIFLISDFPLRATRLRGHKLRGHKLRENNIFLIPAYAGTGLDSRFRGNDKKECG